MFFAEKRGGMKLLPGILCILPLTGLAGCKTGLFKARPVAVKAQPVAPAPVVQGFCPKIMLRDGTAYHTVYARGAKGDPARVVYQASLAGTTRSCTRSRTSLTIKAMAQGRLVAGPMGKAEKVSLPIRIAAVDAGKVVYSRLTRLPVDLTDPAQPRQFLFSKDAVLPDGISASARIYIGFDPGPRKNGR